MDKISLLTHTNTVILGPNATNLILTLEPGELPIFTAFQKANRVRALCISRGRLLYKSHDREGTLPGAHQVPLLHLTGFKHTQSDRTAENVGSK